MPGSITRRAVLVRSRSIHLLDRAGRDRVLGNIRDIKTLPAQPRGGVARWQDHPDPAAVPLERPDVDRELQVNRSGRIADTIRAPAEQDGRQPRYHRYLRGSGRSVDVPTSPTCSRGAVVEWRPHNAACPRLEARTTSALPDWRRRDGRGLSRAGHASRPRGRHQGTTR